jgi:hypothetical protein
MYLLNDPLPQWLIPTVPGSCGLYRGGNNSAEFAVFRDNRDNIFGGKQGTFADQLEPNRCFVEFLEYNFQLVDEIRSTFRTSRLTVISGCCSA